MPRKIIGLLLLAAGIWVFAAGWSRKESILGSLAETGTSLANTFDGGTRTPRHYVYLGGGTVLAAAGIYLLIAAQRRS